MFLKIARDFGLLITISVSIGCGNHVFFPDLQARAALTAVTEQNAAADVEGDRLVRSRISSLEQLGLLGTKVAESKADTCYIKPICVGFGCETWMQYCELDYVVGYTAPLSRDETFDRILAASRDTKDGTFPPRLQSGPCGYSADPARQISYVPANSDPSVPDCRIPDPVNGIDPRHFGERKPGNTKFEYTFDPKAIDQSVDLIWITYFYTYYSEDIGCKGFSCMDTPRKAPIQAD